ncbi:chorismate--pyruvate lyase family protein [Methylophilus aquaticus]|uniref:Probable chorismate pyruvate-lyase n=1 Tax=Methylophilus aquaticus TaxID=1971610 RepID=A0ABT9JPJ7_9PROT|nr:chorismate lyase [Methylophilus aquaticus]MDP8566474.1 chorismate lyase [Methylophilus aquaticus]
MKAVLHRHDAYWLRKLVGQQQALRSWLLESGSLTARLKKQYADFSVIPLRQEWLRPHRDERQILGIASSQSAWVREVWLTGNGQPKVFAHSVISRHHLRGPWYALRKMGRQPLGGALFADPKVRRGILHYKKLSVAHPLYQLIASRMVVADGEVLWARRSLFRLNQYSLLVTEVFLPGFFTDIN